MVEKFMKKAGKVARGLVSAGAIGLAASQANALDSNWYFKTTPIDMDPNVAGIQWIRGTNKSNQFDVLMTVGADMPLNVKISGIAFTMSDFDGNAGTSYSFVSANIPSPTDTRDIFYNKIMDINTLQLNSSTANNRLIDTLQDTRVDATNFISNIGLYGSWYESVADSVALGTLTNVAKNLSPFTITVNNGITSYNIPVAQIKRLPTPEYQLVDSLSVPEPTSGVLTALALACGAAAGGRRRESRLPNMVRNSQVPNNHNRVYASRGSRRS